MNERKAAYVENKRELHADAEVEGERRSRLAEDENGERLGADACESRRELVVVCSGRIG